MTDVHGRPENTRDEKRIASALMKFDCFRTHQSQLHSDLTMGRFENALPQIRAMIRDLKLLEAIVRDVAADQVLSGDREFSNEEEKRAQP